MNARENTLRCIRFERPDYIPMTFVINPACWRHCDQAALKDLIAAHPRLFPACERPEGPVRPKYLPNALADRPYTDPWDCVWTTTDDGITGSVHTHPLESWDAFESYRAPDVETTDGRYAVQWPLVAKDVEERRRRGELIWASMPHGHTFLRLCDIRGYEDLLLDMAEDHPNIPRLIGMVEEFNARCAQKWLALAPDVMDYPEDLGMQVGPMISPALFRKYIRPVYERIMQPARKQGCLVGMHSDGDIRSLADDLVASGVQILNLQDLVNGIGWIAGRFRGKVCIYLDLDRQAITRFGTPQQIDALLREEVETLGSREGGLMIVYGLYPGVPLPNVKAIMDAMERYTGHYA